MTRYYPQNRKWSRLEIWINDHPRLSTWVTGTVVAGGWIMIVVMMIMEAAR